MQANFFLTRKILTFLFFLCLICSSLLLLKFAYATDSKPEIPYFYGLQGVTYDMLRHQYHCDIAVIDPDDSKLIPSQIADIKQHGTTLIAYLSIGAAEPYRNYWQKDTMPDYVAGLDTKWGSYKVKFWSSEWQNLTLARVKSILQRGYDGLYLDVISAYKSPDVIQAYSTEFKVSEDEAKAAAQRAMVDFVILVSQTAKSLNPHAKIIPNNGLQLLATLDDRNLPNHRYLNAIDGIGLESTFIYHDKEVPWTKNNMRYINLALEQGKTAFTIEYSTTPEMAHYAINQAIENGLIPYIAHEKLDDKITDINLQLYKLIPANTIQHFTE